MGFQDLIVTPIYLILFLGGAYFLRPYFSAGMTKKYFVPAICLKFVGAITLGLIYQYHYGGGDTFNYWQHGSRWIWEAFVDDPLQGLGMVFGDIRDPQYYKYYSEIWLRRSDSSIFLIRVLAVIDLFTFRTYSATSLFFALFSFSGLWAMYQAVNRLYSGRPAYLAAAIFLIPSVVIWGSGIMKDTLVIGALGWMTWSLISWIEFRKVSMLNVVVFVLNFMIIYKLKIYVVIAFIPAVVIWIYFKNLYRFKSMTVRLLLAPVLLGVFLVLAFLVAQNIGAGSSRYALEDIPVWSKITAYDLRYWTGRDAGSGYSLGELDGTWAGMLRLMPSAINVAIFRPYPWEVTNALMALTSAESFFVMLITISMLLFHFETVKRTLFRNPLLMFFLGFSLVFAFSVGASTYNFGSLARYRIPMLPFFAVVLAFIAPQGKNRSRKS